MDTAHDVILDGVDWALLTCAQRAEALLPFDLRILEGVRSIAEQKRNIKNGASLTLSSRHLDGRAIDIAPIINGKISWHWPHYYQIAAAMRTVAREMKLTLIWGGVWDRTLNALKMDTDAEVAAYVARRKKIAPKRKVLIDGPHYELDPRVLKKARPTAPGIGSMVFVPAKTPRPGKAVAANSAPVKPIPAKSTAKNSLKPGIKK
jgi:peptidoglycan LD-endopeptidase CwlK